MATPRTAGPASAAALNRSRKADLRLGTIFADKELGARRQRLLLFGVREAVIARCFVRRRRNAAVLIAAIVPPFTVAIGNRARKVLRVSNVSPGLIGFCCARCGESGYARDRDERKINPHSFARGAAELEGAQSRCICGASLKALALWRSRQPLRRSIPERYLRGARPPSQTAVAGGADMNAATIAVALVDARREGRAWCCRYPLHGGRTPVAEKSLSDRRSRLLHVDAGPRTDKARTGTSEYAA
jgi:hypothetical protein